MPEKTEAEIDDERFLDGIAKAVGLRLVQIPATRKCVHGWRFMKYVGEEPVPFTLEFLNLHKMAEVIPKYKNFRQEPGVFCRAHSDDVISNPFYSMSRDEIMLRLAVAGM